MASAMEDAMDVGEEDKPEFELQEYGIMCKAQKGDKVAIGTKGTGVLVPGGKRTMVAKRIGERAEAAARRKINELAEQVASAINSSRPMLTRAVEARRAPAELMTQQARRSALPPARARRWSYPALRTMTVSTRGQSRTRWTRCGVISSLRSEWSAPPQQPRQPLRMRLGPRLPPLPPAAKTGSHEPCRQAL